MPGEIDADEPVIASPATQKLAHSDVSRDRSGMAGAPQSPGIPVAHSQLPESCVQGKDGGGRCHCGRESCAWLRHSNELVGDLERDVKAAGLAGQALLIRHETYVAEAEAGRREMGEKIAHLESDKHNLEIENHRLVEENRDFSDHVEELNNKILESDVRIDSLEATLNATRMEMRRLENLASRTSDLEGQLLELEREQEELRQTITHTEAEEKAAIRRWKAAERKVADLQDQLEKIESEAHDEKLRHEEVLRRMERQKLVDRELQSGKATVSAKSGPNVVSHFVKDILQDNVNLQMGIVELREMLMSSNDEVQKLRDQLNGREPMEEDEPRTKRIESTLDTELAAKEPLASSPALHVHHHYHVPKAQEVRRAVPKKRRSVALPDRALHSRNSSRHRHQPRQPSIAATILSQTSMTIPSPTRPQPSHRWSMQSYGAPSEFASSAPSSPQEYRSSILFDRMSINQSMDYSRPTSPEMSDYATSPAFRPTHKRKVSEQSSNSSRNISPRDQQIFPNDTIHEEEDDDVPRMQALETEAPRSPVTQDDSGVGLESERADTFDPFASSHGFQPKLRRSNSHESILSISGQDIHTLKARPSQMSINKSGAVFGLTSRGSCTNLGTSSAVLSTVDVFGTGELSAATTVQGRIDSRSLLRSTAGLPERPMTAKSAASSEDTIIGPAPKKQGGWIWGRWGMKPSSTPSSSTSTPAQSRAASCVDVHPPPNAQQKKLAARAVTMPVRKLIEEERDPLKLMLGRSPGINQSGPIPGLRKPPRAPSQVVPLRVDFEALREVLEEEGWTST